MEKLVPKNQGEAVAVFRSQVVGTLPHRQLSRGQLRAALRELSQQTFRPPGAQVTRRYSVPTLERWYYRWRKGGLAALVPKPRGDVGMAQALEESVRQLLLDVRREHPSASVRLILRTLVESGRLREGAVSESTCCRARLLMEIWTGWLMGISEGARARVTLGEGALARREQ